MSQGDGVSQGDGDFDPRANAPSPLHRATCPPDRGDRGLDTGTGVVSRGSLPVEAKGRSFCFHLSQGNESGGGWEAKGCSF